MFDQKKLEWVNSTYIKALSEEEYYKFILPFVNEVEGLKNTDEDRKKEISLFFKNELNYGKEIVKLINEVIIKNEDLTDEEKALIDNDNAKKVIALFKEKFEKIPEIDAVNVKNIFNEIKQETGLKGKEIFMPIRIKLTGMMHGIEMHNILKILGKEEVSKRLS